MFQTILQKINETSVGVITVEEHTIMGGLGSIVGNLVAENCWNRNLQFKAMALPDDFPDMYGSQNEMIAYYKIDVDDIHNTAKEMLNKSKM